MDSEKFLLVNMKEKYMGVIKIGGGIIYLFFRVIYLFMRYECQSMSAKKAKMYY